MDNQTYESLDLPEESVAEVKDFLKAGLNCQLVLFNNIPVKADLPVKIEYKVVSTMPGIKGDTATGGTKPAVIESGATIQVPLFIKEGEVIRVNTTTGEYVERVTA